MDVHAGAGYLNLFVLLVAFSSIAVNAQEPIDFAHDILPILKNRCAECHTNGTYQGGLSLETRQSLLESSIIESNDHANSELYLRVVDDDPETRMPPAGQPLTAQQIQLIADWIDQGSPWPEEISLAKKSFRRALDLPQFDPIEENLIDVVVGRYFGEHQISYPAKLDDGQFLRRAKMDLLGLLPTIQEWDQFVANTDLARDEQLVDQLLARDRDYADHWISFWNDLLRNDYVGTGYIDGGRKQISGWLHRSLMDNKPYDQFVRELVHPEPAAAGFIKGIQWRGNVNASQIQPLQFSQNVSQVFLGVNMKCAACHDSFIDHWKLEDAYSMAAIIASSPLEMHRCDVPTGQMATSRFLFPELGTIDHAATPDQRLQQLANLLTDKKNGRFARTIVNRLWQRMFGRGLIEPIDVMANSAWNEELLDRLAVDLVKHGYDLKRTLRLMVTSKIYRRQAVAQQATQSASVTAYRFRGVQPKRLTAEQFVDAVWWLADQYPDKPADSLGLAKDDTRVRAALVPADSLMRVLGRPNREQVVTTRPTELSTLQALTLTTGSSLSPLIEKIKQQMQTRSTKDAWPDQRLFRDLFRRSLTREPSDEELRLLMGSDWEDAIWIVLMLPEFQFVN